MRILPLILIALLACCERAVPSPPAEPWQPFAERGWVVTPSDDEFVDALVGKGGDDDDRKRFRSLVSQLPRSYLLGERHPTDSERLESMRNQLRGYRLEFVDLVQRDHLTRLEAAFLIIVEEVVASFNGRAVQVAAAHMHKDLWPTEPYPPAAAYRDLTLSEVRRRAEELENEFAAFRARTELVVPRVFPKTMVDAPAPYDLANWSVRMTYDALRIATGQGYARSCWTLHYELIKHGIATTMTPEPPPRTD